MRHDERQRRHLQVPRRLRLAPLAGAVLFGAACDRPAATSPAPATPPAIAAPAAETAVWHTLGTWSGHGSGQTGSFDVGTGSLRVKWEARASAPDADRYLTVVLHSAISGRPLQTVLDVHEPGAGTAFVQDEPRVSYLDVTAPGMDWRLSVEEMLPRPAGR